ncbi:MAG TPA: hypothetical protein DCF33_06815, partial [Saprospirales bacterium]|nr:hypothetical protein [Saprospirales bacterium]
FLFFFFSVFFFFFFFLFCRFFFLSQKTLFFSLQIKPPTCSKTPAQTVRRLPEPYLPGCRLRAFA